MLVGRRHRRAMPVALGLVAVITSVPRSRWNAMASEDEDGDEGGSGDGSGDSWEDDDFYGFDDGDTVWDGMAIVPEKCINLNGQDTVVFELYNENNNQCSKGSQGKYTTDVRTFVKAYTKQLHEDAEISGYDYDKPDYLDYLDCTGYQANDDDGADYVYFKIGCLSTTGLNLEMNVYSDQYCTEQIVGSNWKPDSDDINYLKKHIKFGSCHSCVTWPQQNGDDDEAEADVDDNFWNEHAYESPLCSAANYYKEDCGRKCKKLAKSAGNQQSHRGFSRAGRFWLLVFSLLGLFLLFEVVKQRKKMSAEDSLLEEAAIQRSGLQKRQVALLVIAGIFLILIFMICRLKVLTWICLLGSCLCLLAYLFYLRYRARGKVEVGGFRLFGDNGASGGQSSDFAPPPRQVEMS